MDKRKVTYTEFLDESPMSGFLWLLVCGICLAQLLDGLDFQSTAFALPGIIKEFKINPIQAGVIGSVANIGLAAGMLIFSLISDRFGRRLVFQWVLFTYTFGTLVCALAPNLHVLLVGRFLAGLGLGAETPLAVTILAEFSPKRLRHILVPMAPMFFGLGWVLAAVVSIGMVPAFGWRSLYWIGVTPALVILLIRRVLPESIRFLLSRGRVEEAGKIANDLARRAGRTDIELIAPGTVTCQKLSFGQQLGVLRTMWLSILVLGLFMIGYYILFLGLNAWLPTLFMRQGFSLHRSFTFTLIILMASPIGCVIAMWIQNKMARTWLILLLTLLSTVFFLLFGVSFRLGFPIGVAIGAQLLQGLCFHPIMPIVLTLSGELFPTPLRAFGTSIVNAIGRVGAIIGPLFLGVLVSRGTSLTNIVYWLAFPLVVTAILVVIFIRIDPRGQSLEMITQIAEVREEVPIGF